MPCALQIERAVLHVEYHEIEPACGRDFHHHGTRGEHDDTDYVLACAKPLPDGIDLQRHDLTLHIEARKSGGLTDGGRAALSYRTVPR